MVAIQSVAVGGRVVGRRLPSSDRPHETNAARAWHELAELRERTALSDQAKANILGGMGVRRVYQR